jgi:hypothetical protein
MVHYAYIACLVVNMLEFTQIMDGVQFAFKSNLLQWVPGILLLYILLLCGRCASAHKLFVNHPVVTYLVLLSVSCY